MNMVSRLDLNNIALHETVDVFLLVNSKKAMAVGAMGSYHLLYPADKLDHMSTFILREDEGSQQFESRMAGECLDYLQGLLEWERKRKATLRLRVRLHLHYRDELRDERWRREYASFHALEMHAFDEDTYQLARLKVKKSKGGRKK